VEVRKRVLGADHPSMLTSMNNLALTYKDQGRWKEAEVLQVQVMEASKAEELEVHVLRIRKRVLGADHPSTLSSMANLASTYWNQGRWIEPEIERFLGSSIMSSFQSN
ncbi:hypothetical protein K469DRAFT_769813, partial [Zopfia rhizophila CBS 207.26]